MGGNLVRFEGDFDARFEAKKDELTAEVSNIGRGFGEKMAELVQMQQAEILRLQGILRDSTTLPERYPVEVAIGTAAGENGRIRHALLAIASDRSVWMLSDYVGQARVGAVAWKRVPNLPQAADELDHGG